MANLYRVDYTSCVKVGSAGPNQMRTQTESKVVYVSATTEANAVAAVKTNDYRNGNTNLDYVNFQVQLKRASILVGS